MFKLTLGEEVKFRIPQVDKGQIYRVILSYDIEENEVPILYWTEHDGFPKAGASSCYTLKEVEESLNNGTWVRIG